MSLLLSLHSKEKHTSCRMAFLFGVFCKVLRKYSVAVSFGCDLAPSLLERRRKDFKGRRWQTIQGRVSREINTSSTEELGCRRGWGEAVGCKQRKEVGILDTEWSQKDHAAFSQIHGHQVEMAGDKTVKGKWACARHGNRGLKSQTGRL